MMIARETLAGRVREVRVACFGAEGVPALAERPGLPPATWRNHEAGVTIPGPFLPMLVELTGASPAYLLRGEGPAPRATWIVAAQAGSRRPPGPPGLGSGVTGSGGGVPGPPGPGSVATGATGPGSVGGLAGGPRRTV